MTSIDAVTDIFQSKGISGVLNTSLRVAHNRLYNNWFKIKYGKGVDIMSEDWDNFIILDACRYDYFKQENTIDGKLESRISKGRNSQEFMQENFVGGEFHDTVYVTANPFVANLEHGTFHSIIDTPLTKYWNSELDTVLPKDMTDVAINANNDYQNKRLIVHFMQPHYPYLGNHAEKLYEKAEIDGIDKYVAMSDQAAANRNTVWDAITKGKINEEMVRKAYRATLNIVLDEVERLLSHLEGRTIISADHGEFLGEKPTPLMGKSYGHRWLPRSIELCKVPWLIIEASSKRPQITSAEPIRKTTLTRSKMEDQLRALGYRA